MTKKLPDADYTGMQPSKWPEIDPEYLAAFNHAIEICRKAEWVSKHERAIWHRWIHYSFEKGVM